MKKIVFLLFVIFFVFLVVCFGKQAGTTQNDDTNVAINAPEYTKEEYAQMRQNYPFERSTILDYDCVSTYNGFLEIDETADKIKNYLNSILCTINPGEEINSAMDDNNFIYRTAAFNTSVIHEEDDAILNSIPYATYPMMKEHVAQTAKLLFGENCHIDFAALTDTRQFLYDDYYGVAALPPFGYLPVRFGHVPVVTSYMDHGDYYTATIVYVFWSTLAPAPDIYYTDNTYETTLKNKDDCQLLTKYKVTINKGENGKIYFVSCLLADK